MAENTDPADQSPLPPVPRRTAAPQPSVDSARMERLASLVDSVQVLATELNDEAADNADPSKDRPGRRQKKFRRTAVSEERRIDPPVSGEVPALVPPPGDPVSNETEPPPEEAGTDVLEKQNSADATALNKSIAWPRLPHDDPPPNAMRPKRKRRSMTIPLLILMACNMVMLVFGYIVGLSVMAATKPPAGMRQPSVEAGLPPAPIDPLSPQGVSDAALDAADAALDAEKNGDGAAARRLYDDAVHQRIGLMGAEYRLALVAIKRGDLLDADLHLIHSAQAGEYLGPSHFVRATFAGAKGNYAEAGRQLEAAARADPLNAKYFFCWGECLRRQGKPHAAADCIKQALHRAYSPEEGDLYLFKHGLAEVESGGDEAFNASFTHHLQATSVPGDWLLLAAARDLERGAYPDAADHLQKAEDALPAAVFDSRLRDYFFQAYAKRPEFAVFFTPPRPPPVTEAGPSILDPAAWSPEKADPGTWPSTTR